MNMIGCWRCSQNIACLNQGYGNLCFAVRICTSCSNAFSSLTDQMAIVVQRIWPDAVYMGIFVSG
eukprot:1489115-Pleurochrysis_carterae.AAC.2